MAEPKQKGIYRVLFPIVMAGETSVYGSLSLLHIILAGWQRGLCGGGQSI
ncbi:hypothetical protein [Ohtaekwangia koreensis]|nr:hypothetical protein [Ohtaekwangia koreensis]